MITDCPNCSWRFETKQAIGESASCPFCNTVFQLFLSPFEQLKSYLEVINPNFERSPFFNPNYATWAAYKNYLGWVVHRIRTNQIEEVFKLCCIFMHPIQAEMMLNTIWNFDFRQYVTASDDAFVELLAIWIVSGFCLLEHPLSFAALIAEHLWIHPIAIRPEYMDLALQQAEEQRMAQCPEDAPIQKEDLMLNYPMENPLLDWSLEAPLAIRQRLILALLYSGHATYNNERRCWIRLDDCTYYDSRMHGVDYGYATRKLMESNIFCEPPLEHFEKFFSREEYFSFLNEFNIPTKKSFTRKRMLAELLDADGGEVWLRNKIADDGYVQLHPTLVKYAIELEKYYRNFFLLWKTILMFDYKKDCPISSFLSENRTMAHGIEDYLRGMELVDTFPAWKYHCQADYESCFEHLALEFIPK